ncbi:hypothetical protein [Bordetella bronchiseptica]|uniref:hypothetical protein n=1 Tax=Bordetella bronchiseptica TaxID=518 RepID=UPI000305E035|nr:hypothetical protein [Bordetella bronchiseptica]
MTILANFTRRLTLAATLATTLAAFGPTAQAAGFPAEGRPVRIVVDSRPAAGRTYWRAPSLPAWPASCRAMSSSRTVRAPAA